MADLSRRDFIKGLAAGALSVGVSAVAGHTPAFAEGEAAENTAPENIYGEPGPFAEDTTSSLGKSAFIEKQYLPEVPAPTTTEYSCDVLVIGDVIIDEYVFCGVQGVTMKDGAMSTRYEHTERYAGGSLAVRHGAGRPRHRQRLVGVLRRIPLRRQDGLRLYPDTRERNGMPRSRRRADSAVHKFYTFYMFYTVKY